MAEKYAASKGKALLWAVLTGLAAALGYFIAELLTQHDLTWAWVSMLGIFVVLTGLFYWANLRNMRAVAAPSPTE